MVIWGHAVAGIGSPGGLFAQKAEIFALRRRRRLAAVAHDRADGGNDGATVAAALVRVPFIA